MENDSNLLPIDEPNNPKSEDKKPYDLKPNMEAALAYLTFGITAIISLIYENDDKFVRFHSAQAIAFVLTVLIAFQISAITMPILIGFILSPIVSIGSFAFWIVLIWKSYNNEMWELPYIGSIVKDVLQKNSK